MIIKNLGLQLYMDVWHAMYSFTDNRNPETEDELWLLEHFPVFTQGQAGRSEHILNPKDIPVVQTDRGGQVTYHGPGQLVAYPLIDLRRINFGVKQFVHTLENSVIELLANFKINAASHPKAPGVYVDEKKICSIGLKIRRGCSYHGIALNVDMDLEPFSRINPCGFQNLQMTQIKDFFPAVTMSEVQNTLSSILSKHLQQ